MGISTVEVNAKSINRSLAVVGSVRAVKTLVKQKWLHGAFSFKATVVLILLVLFNGHVFGQTTYDWLNTAPDGNFKQGAAGARWNPGGLWDEPPYGIVQFNNNNQVTMTNNVAGTWSQHKFNFGAAATTARTIGGNPVQFFDFGGTWPFIRNQSSANHTINFNVLVGTGGTWNGLELVNTGGNLTFGGTINNQGKNLYIYGNNIAVDGTNRSTRWNGIVSGAGFVNVSQFGVLKLNAANTYTGQTQIDNGELWIESSGSIAAGSGIFVGNGGQLGNVTKLWLSNTAGGTTMSNAITINNGNATTREIGGLNTSGTHTFSGNITNNSTTGGLLLSTINAGGSVTFSGVLSGGGAYTTQGAGTITFSGAAANTYTGITTVNAGILRLSKSTGVNAIPGNTTISGGTLQLGAANVIADASNITLNGGTFRTGSAAGFGETVGTLTVSANSTIALGTGAHTLTFANSSAVSWNSTAILTITGWTGAYNGTAGTAGRIFIGASASNLTAQQLSQIRFNNGTLNYTATLLGTGELVPLSRINEWTGATSTAWLTTTNWLANTVAGSTTSTNTDVALFNVNSQTTSSINMNTQSGNHYLSAIHWGTGATTARTINNSSSTTPGTLHLNATTLNGIANTILLNQATGTHLITNGSNTMNLRPANGSNNVI